jgi:hypothetical protein
MGVLFFNDIEFYPKINNLVVNSSKPKQMNFMNFRYFNLIFATLFLNEISVAQLGTISVLKKRVR